jgi:hypothetical protein
MKLMSQLIAQVVFIPKFDASFENSKQFGIKGSKCGVLVISRFTSFFEQTTIYPRENGIRRSRLTQRDILPGVWRTQVLRKSKT